MNEIDKLMQNVGTCKVLAYLECHRGTSDIGCPITEEEKDEKCSQCVNSNVMHEVWKYPPLTIEKQFKLLKWLMFDCCYYISPTKWDNKYGLGITYEDIDELFEDESFEIVLAKLLNFMWTFMQEDEKDEVRRIINEL